MVKIRTKILYTYFHTNILDKMAKHMLKKISEDMCKAYNRISINSAKSTSIYK